MATVKDRVENQERVEKLTEEKKDDYFTKLILGKDVVEEVETSRGKFEVKYPTTADLISIGKIAAFRRGYKPAEAFDAETDMIIAMASTLDVIVLSGPQWYENAKTVNKNFSFLEVPSRVFINELYGKAYSFREKIEQSFNPTAGTIDKSISTEKSNDGSVGGGAFEGLSSQ